MLYRNTLPIPTVLPGIWNCLPPIRECDSCVLCATKAKLCYGLEPESCVCAVRPEESLSALLCESPPKSALQDRFTVCSATYSDVGDSRNVAGVRVVG